MSYAQQQILGLGASANDGTGDTIRAALSKLGATSPGIITPLTVAAANMPNSRTKLAAIKAGTASARMRIAIVGDSIGYGFGAGVGNGIPTGAAVVNPRVDCRRRGWPAKLAAILTDIYGVPAAADSMFGDGYTGGANVSILISTTDPRIAFSGTAWLNGSAIVAGGNAISNSTGGNTEYFTFTPDGLVDTAIITWIAVAGSSASINVSIDGGVNQTFNTAIGGSSGGTLASTNINLGSAGVHSIGIAKVPGNTGTSWICSIECFNSLTKSVDIINMSASGWNSTLWTGATYNYSPLNALKYYAPDLTIISLGPNGWATNTLQESVSTFTTNITSIVTAAKISGEVMLVVPTPTAIGSVLSRTLRSNMVLFRTAILGLQASLSCIPLDLQAIIPSHQLGDAAGLFDDGAHPSNAGHGKIAGAVAAVLMS